MKRTSLCEMRDRATTVVKTAEDKTRRMFLSFVDEEPGLYRPQRANGKLVVQRRGAP